MPQTATEKLPKGSHRLLGSNLTIFKVAWMAAFPKWWRYLGTNGSAYYIFISILLLRRSTSPSCGVAIASSPGCWCIARARVSTQYCWDTATVSGLPIRAAHLLFSVTATSVLYPFLFPSLDLLLAEACIWLFVSKPTLWKMGCRYFRFLNDTKTLLLNAFMSLWA